MKAWKFIFAALVVFAAGAMTGATVSSFRAKVRHQQESAKRQTVPLFVWQRFEFLRRAQRQLELTSDQHTRIEAHIRESQDRLRKLWEPLAPTAKAELEQLRSSINSELTPEQQSKLDSILLRPRFGRRSGDGTNGIPSDARSRPEEPRHRPAN